jgi:Holliday junction DNA helicase RuvA subunit
MIKKLSGILDELLPDGVILNVSGIGFFIMIPMSLKHTLYTGQTYTFYIDMMIRQDGVHLFGFIDAHQHQWFAILNGVQGIGPKTALNILSSLSIDQMIEGIVSQNKYIFKNISGLGPKSITRLLNELKDRPDLPVSSHLSPYQQEAFLALQNLGFDPAKIMTAFQQVPPNNMTHTTENLVKHYLEILTS